MFAEFFYDTSEAGPTRRLQFGLTSNGRADLYGASCGIRREIATPLLQYQHQYSRAIKENYHTIVLAAAGAQMEEWWGQLGPCDTALLCTVSRHTGHQPRALSSGDYHGYYLLFTATPRVDVSSAAAVWMQSAELVLASSSHSCSLLQ